MAAGYDFWNREIVDRQHVSWLEEPRLHDYANRLIGNGVPMWPLDWFTQWLEGRRFNRALSIGCGTGELERDLIQRRLVETVDAFDGSIASLHVARRCAMAAGIAGRVRYFAADFNRPILPKKKYDLVLFHQSAHHVAKLEKLFREVLGALRADGLLYLDEYVGPSRVEWSDLLIAPQREIYDSLPPTLRSIPVLPYPIQADDPSEAFRSSEIESQLRVGFHRVAHRPYGGILLSVIYPMLKRSALTADIIDDLVAKELDLLRSGFSSYYAVLVLRPRRGLGKLYARAHYFLIPKLKRIRREIQSSFKQRRRGIVKQSR